MSIMYSEYMHMFKNSLRTKSDAELIAMSQKYRNNIMYDVSTRGTTPQETMNEYTAINVELNKRGLS